MNIESKELPSSDHAETAIYYKIKNGEVSCVNIYSKKLGSGTSS